MVHTTCWPPCGAPPHRHARAAGRRCASRGTAARSRPPASSCIWGTLAAPPPPAAAAVPDAAAARGVRRAPAGGLLVAMGPCRWVGAMVGAVMVPSRLLCTLLAVADHKPARPCANITSCGAAARARSKRWLPHRSRSWRSRWPLLLHRSSRPSSTRRHSSGRPRALPSSSWAPASSWKCAGGGTSEWCCAGASRVACVGVWRKRVARAPHCWCGTLRAQRRGPCTTQGGAGCAERAVEKGGRAAAAATKADWGAG